MFLDIDTSVYFMTLDLSSLPTIIYVIKNAVNWKALGVQLNFEESILDEMESSDDRMSMEMMLSEWLKRGRTTRQILDEAIVKVISKGNLWNP